MGELRSACLEVVVLNVNALDVYQKSLFTAREAERASQMGARRLRTFTAARAALKILARTVGAVGKNTPEWEIETLDADGVKPCLAGTRIHCSASHSSRFVVAVAHCCPIGVDIEAVSKKTLRIRDFFLGPKERDLVSSSNLGPERTMTRVWTIKEASVKLLRVHLLEALREVEIVRVGEKEGAMKYRGKMFPVRHAEGEGEVIALISADAS
jgi:phosphopantetheinyl transferase